MDFFEHEAKARRKTSYLVFLFALAVIMIIAAVYVIVDLFYICEFYRTTPGMVQAAEPSQILAVGWNPVLLGWVAIIVGGIIGIGSLYRCYELRQGGSVVAAMLGGRPVNLNTQDLDERKLLNVVEEMALAAGMAVPEVYILDNEDGINAFAAGHARTDTVVAVTRGAITTLTRDELQGVIGHEFSHILNGDMRMNMHMLGILFGILCVAQIGSLLMRVRTDDRKGGGIPILLLGLALFLIGSIGIFFGKLIRSAIARQREFLADASAVQFTRNPDGITGALKKIGGYTRQSFLKSSKSQEVSHFLFGESAPASWFDGRLLASHPPLEDRIRAIDPSFRGSFPKVIAPISGIELEPGLALSAGSFLAPLTAISVKQPSVANAILGSIGQVTTNQLNQASAIKSNLPDAIVQASRQTVGACALVTALLIAGESHIQKSQTTQLQAQADPAIYAEAGRLYPVVQQLPANSRVAVIDLAIPALRQLSPDQYRRFRQNIEMLVNADSEVNLFEYALQKIMQRYLDSYFQTQQRPPPQYRSLQPLIPDALILLSALAYAAHGQSQLAGLAFQKGARELDTITTNSLPFASQDECKWDALDNALDRLNQATPTVKKNVLHACATTVMSDGIVEPEEWELMRAIADTLECPIPPFVQTAFQGNA